MRYYKKWRKWCWEREGKKIIWQGKFLHVAIVTRECIVMIILLEHFYSAHVIGASYYDSCIFSLLILLGHEFFWWDFFKGPPLTHFPSRSCIFCSGEERGSSFSWEKGYERAVRKSADLKQPLEMEELLEIAKCIDSIAQKNQAVKSTKSSSAASDSVNTVESSETVDHHENSNGKIEPCSKSTDCWMPMTTYMTDQNFFRTKLFAISKFSEVKAYHSF